jgi:hypothetical protein
MKIIAGKNIDKNATIILASSVLFPSLYFPSKGLIFKCTQPLKRRHPNPAKNSKKTKLYRKKTFLYSSGTDPLSTLSL